MLLDQIVIKWTNWKIIWGEILKMYWPIQRVLLNFWKVISYIIQMYVLKLRNGQSFSVILKLMHVQIHEKRLLTLCFYNTFTKASSNILAKGNEDCFSKPEISLWPLEVSISLIRLTLNTYNLTDTCSIRWKPAQTGKISYLSGKILLLILCTNRATWDVNVGGFFISTWTCRLVPWPWGWPCFPCAL